MPSRRLPQTHVTRAQVLRQASLKGNATAPLDRAVPAALWAKLDLTAGVTPAKTYIAALDAIDPADHTYGLATEAVEPLLHTALQLISHFFQVLDLAIARGFWPASVREFYGRDIHVARLPVLDTAADAMEWGEKIELGEAARVAAGGQPMAMPTADEVRVAVYNLVFALNPQTVAKDALILAQQAPDNLLPGPAGIEKLILDLYNDVENHYRDYPDGARRDLCRAWGLIYDDDAAPIVPPVPPPPPVP